MIHKRWCASLWLDNEGNDQDCNCGGSSPLITVAFWLLMFALCGTTLWMVFNSVR